MTKIKPLKLNKLCQNFTFREIAVLAQYVEVREYKKDAVIFSQGDRGEHVYLIYKGEVGIKSTIFDASDYALKLGSDEFFGELALFEAGSRRVTAVALADNTILLLIAKKDFQKLCAEEPFISYKLIMRIITYFSSKLREGQNELSDLLSSRAK